MRWVGELAAAGNGSTHGQWKGKAASLTALGTQE